VRSAAIAVTDSEDVFVASTQSGRTTASSSAKTFCLTASSSNTASTTTSASAKTPVSVLPVTSAFSLLAPSGETRRLPSSASTWPCTYASPLATRSSSRSVMTTGTSSR